MQKIIIKGVIYDLDDLMVTSTPLHDESDELLLKERGIVLMKFQKN